MALSATSVIIAFNTSSKFRWIWAWSTNIIVSLRIQIKSTSTLLTWLSILIATLTSFYQIFTWLKYILNICLIVIFYIERCLVISWQRYLTDRIATLLSLKCWITSYKCTCFWRIKIICKCALTASRNSFITSFTRVIWIKIKYVRTLTCLIWAILPSILCITLRAFFLIINLSYSCITSKTLTTILTL